MVIAAEYPFLSIVGTMVVFFGFVIWFWLLIRVFGDVFRRRDIGGWAKSRSEEPSRMNSGLTARPSQPSMPRPAPRAMAGARRSSVVPGRGRGSSSQVPG